MFSNPWYHSLLITFWRAPPPESIGFFANGFPSQLFNMLDDAIWSGVLSLFGLKTPPKLESVSMKVWNFWTGLVLILLMSSMDPWRLTSTWPTPKILTMGLQLRVNLTNSARPKANWTTPCPSLSVSNVSWRLLCCNSLLITLFQPPCLPLPTGQLQLLPSTLLNTVYQRANLHPRGILLRPSPSRCPSLGQNWCPSRRPGPSPSLRPSLALSLPSPPS